MDETSSVDFAGNALAPNVLLVKQDIARLDASLRSEGKGALLYRFPDRGAKESKRKFGPSINPEQNDADLYAGIGFGPFLDPDVHDLLFNEQSLLEPYMPARRSSLFCDAGIMCSEGSNSPFPCPVTVHSVSPFVMLVNKHLLGDLPVPSSWEDLLDDCWRAQLLVTPEEPMCNMAYLGIYSMFGADGLKNFARNVACAASASVMGMLPSQPRPGTGSVYVVPWFFARCCSGNPDVECVWPREGALAFPLWLAMKRGTGEKAHAVADYFMGDAFAVQSARLCLPAANMASDAALPPDAGKLYWIGWDFLRTLDLEDWAQTVGEATAGIKGDGEL